MGAATILVVDEERRASHAVCRALERHGYRTLAATSPREALVLAGFEPSIDLVLTEVGFRYMSGEDLARAIRTRSKRPPAIVFMSEYRGPEVPPQAPFLQKPFTADALISRVEIVLAQAACARDRLAAEVARGEGLQRLARRLVRENQEVREQARESRRRARQLRAPRAQHRSET